ncbi:MAG: amidohydrolase [Clostridia bacterium]|nr:amidohydrolase [Clostridia bacterium]
MRIDTHVHLYDNALGDFTWPRKGTRHDLRIDERRFLEEAEPYGITHCIAVACTQQPEQLSLVLNELDGPSILAAVGDTSFNSPDFIPIYDSFTKYEKFRGFRTDAGEVPPTDLAYENLSYLKGKKANVIEFNNSPAQLIANVPDLIRSNPDVRFVLEHFGGMRSDLPIVDGDNLEFLKTFSSFDNCFMKASALYLQAENRPQTPDPAPFTPVLTAFYNLFGEERVMFGSDWPALMDYPRDGKYGLEVGIFESFFNAFSPRICDKIMGENAAFVYGIDA